VNEYKKNPYTGIALTLLGMIEDVHGNRELAVRYYKRAKRHKKYGNLNEILSICLKQSYRPDQLKLILDDFFTLPDRS
jgi:hypothetical protein